MTSSLSKFQYSINDGTGLGTQIRAPARYAHGVSRVLHHIWFKTHTDETKKIKGEPIELKQNCLDVNCVGAEGGWKNMHWDERSVQNLTTWPLIQHLWGKTR